MKVNLIARNSTVTTSNVKSISLTQDNTHFFEQMNLEVMQNPKKAKKLLQLLTITYTGLILPLVTSDIALAAPSTSSVVPQDLTDTILVVIGVIAALGVGAAIIALMIAGVWKMAMGRNRASEWTTEIIRGLLQVVISPIIVALIVGIATLLFSNVPAFQPIKSPIEVFFHH